MKRKSGYFSIVYFYSSFARFALVAGVGVVLYLYQIGFFGQPRPVQNNGNPNAAAQQQQAQPAAPEDQQQQLIQQQVEEVRQAAGGGSEQHPEDGGEVGPGVVTPNYFSLATTFVTTFFSSLIPHEPQVV